MGIFNEVAASWNAKWAKTILEQALATANKDVIQFAKDHILPFYLAECSEGCDPVDTNLVRSYAKEEIKT